MIQKVQKNVIAIVSRVTKPSLKIIMLYCDYSIRIHSLKLIRNDRLAWYLSVEIKTTIPTRI